MPAGLPALQEIRSSRGAVIVVVVAAIIRQNGRILITQRFDDVHLPGLWEFPGGKVETHETLETALKREIFEELGVRIQVEDEFFTARHEDPAKSVELHFFNCVLVEGEPQPLDVADLRWVTPPELAQFEFPAADADLIKKLQSAWLPLHD